MSEITVEVWSDLVCPWCYIGKRRLERALADFEGRDEVRVVWRSYQLDPEAPDTADLTLPAHLTERQGLPPEQVAEMLGRVSGIAEGDGLAYRLAEARPANTFDAHRLVHHAAGLGLGAAVQERLLAAYAQEGIALAGHETLARLAAEAGCDEAAARRALADGDHADAVREDIATARQLGITGVPAFVLDRTFLVSGAQPAEAFGRVLRELHARGAA
ncbi:DsbA family oxidoreductase [Streptomyces johnsoniae]|uniref:DsbA family oxidoreductase n=1 Tax=Streptomyces johnsoniae TaxID=3075532 RepID=A0ABU2S450_9ACTN|nr:DsbA family oxidoreductase [Streptomyces sp. DSM 41886]MDT0442395.1 DsbA family oxidoreductase [Streptomyces sp. DSM 41886]